MQVVIIIAFVALAVALVYAGHLAEKKRRAALVALASRLGLRFFEGRDQGFAQRFEGYFPALQRGSNRYAYNILTGRSQGIPVHLFDHHYETYSTDSKGRRQTHHHHASYAILEQGVDLGVMEVRREGFFDKVAAAFGFDDIDFESAEFSRRYHVKAKDRKLAYEILHPKMLEHLLRCDRLEVTTAGTLVMFDRGDRKLDPAEIERTFREGFGFLGLLPRYLRKDRGPG